MRRNGSRRRPSSPMQLSLGGSLIPLRAPAGSDHLHLAGAYIWVMRDRHRSKQQRTVSTRILAGRGGGVGRCRLRRRRICSSRPAAGRRRTRPMQTVHSAQSGRQVVILPRKFPVLSKEKRITFLRMRGSRALQVVGQPLLFASVCCLLTLGHLQARVDTKSVSENKGLSINNRHGLRVSHT